jgi:hypothetical protein
MQFLSEQFLGNHLFQILIGCGYNTGVDGYFAHPADSSDTIILNGPQDSCLRT